MTKKAMLITNTNQLDSLNMASQLTASHFAAPVSHRQNPMLMAPAKRSMMFHGISSRSLMSRTLNTKKSTVEIRIRAVLSMGSRAGINDLSDITAIQESTMTAARISLPVMGPSSELSCLALALNPSITFFSGLQNIMKKPQSAKVMSHPTGNM